MTQWSRNETIGAWVLVQYRFQITERKNFSNVPVEYPSTNIKYLGNS